LFAFVNALVNVPSPSDGRARDGVDLLLHMAGEEHGPAVMLCALLQALGERASVVRDTRRSYVRVEVEARDFSRLPPFAGLFSQGGRYYIPLDARQSRSPLGFLARLPRRAVSGGRRI
jgi:hypothetical protein